MDLLHGALSATISGLSTKRQYSSASPPLLRPWFVSVISSFLSKHSSVFPRKFFPIHFECLSGKPTTWKFWKMLSYFDIIIRCFPFLVVVRINPSVLRAKVLLWACIYQKQQRHLAKTRHLNSAHEKPSALKGFKIRSGFISIISNLIPRAAINLFYSEVGLEEIRDNQRRNSVLCMCHA